MIMFGIPADVETLDDLRLSGLALRIRYFCQDVGPHDVVVQLSFSLAVQTESSDFTFDLSFVGLVPIIFWATGHEFDDVVSCFKLIFEVAKKIAEGWVRPSGTTDENDTVRVVIQTAISQQSKGVIKV